MTSNLFWNSHGVTDCGPARSHNEDAFLERLDAGLWAVADGMGGHLLGDVASALIVERLSSVPATGTLPERVTGIISALRETNRELYAMAGDECVIGSTVAAFVVSGREAACLWAGDSRIYRLRRGILVQLTQDHSYVAALVADGVLTAAQAQQHEMGNVITRAVGAEVDLEVDTVLVSVEADDVFLLCTDGLTCVLSDADLIDALGTKDWRASAADLVKRALNQQTRDNVTAIVVHAGAA